MKNYTDREKLDYYTKKTTKLEKLVKKYGKKLMNTKDPQKRKLAERKYNSAFNKWSNSSSKEQYFWNVVNNGDSYKKFTRGRKKNILKDVDVNKSY
jgi:hypothetical protein